MRSSLILACIAVCALPSVDAAEAQDSTVIPSKWSLEKQVKKPAKPQSKTGSPSSRVRKAATRAKQSPRLYGGARVGNAGRRSSRGGAQVGVAVPF